LILGVAVRDLTGGFKLYRRRVLESLGLDTIRSNGYSFQIEMTYRALRHGFRVVEVPIVFVDRRVGKSKLSRKVVLEAVFMVPRLRLGG
jgi:dolichol-phosphate mannosyltransferase